MPLDTAEGIAAGFRELPIFQAVSQLASALPPAADRKAVDYAPLVGAKPGTVVYKILAEFSDPVHKFADVVDILEIDQSSPLGQQMLAIDILIADIAD